MGFINKLPIFNQLSEQGTKFLGMPPYGYDPAVAPKTPPAQGWGNTTNLDQGGRDAWLARARDQYRPASAYLNSFSDAEEAKMAGGGNQTAMYMYGGQSSLAAYANLMEMLRNNGRTDPRLMNRTLAGIQRNTQGAQQQMQGNLQSRGFQNSGVGAALMAAMGQAGAGQQAGVVAQDASDAEQRKMQALALFQQLIGNPSIDYTSMGMAQTNARKQQQMDKAKMKLGVLAGIGKGISGAGG